MDNSDVIGISRNSVDDNSLSNDDNNRIIVPGTDDESSDEKEFITKLKLTSGTVIEQSTSEESDDSFPDALSIKPSGSKSIQGSTTIEKDIFSPLNSRKMGFENEHKSHSESDSNDDDDDKSESMILHGNTKISVSNLFESNESTVTPSNKRLQKGKKNIIRSSSEDDDATYLHKVKNTIPLKTKKKENTLMTQKDLSYREAEPVVVIYSSESEDEDSNRSKIKVIKSSSEESVKPIKSKERESTYGMGKDMSYRETKNAVIHSSESEDEDLNTHKMKNVIESSSEEEDATVSQHDSFARPSTHLIHKVKHSMPLETKGENNTLKTQQDLSYRETKPAGIHSSNSEDEDLNHKVLISSDSEDLERNDLGVGGGEGGVRAATDAAADLSSSLAEVKLSPSSTSSLPGLNSRQPIVPGSVQHLSNDYSSQKESLIAEEMKLKHQVAEVLREIENTKRAIKSANPAALPDRGVRLQITLKKKEDQLRDLKYQQGSLSNKMIQLHMQGGAMSKTQPPEQKQKFYNLPTSITDVHGMGRTAMETYRVQQSLTLDALRKLHKSLETRPTEETVVADPVGLTCPLLPHQRHALAWLLWREQQSPPGGVLADDMGLGKTLTLISLVLKTMETEEEGAGAQSNDESSEDERDEEWLSKNRKKSIRGNTLVVCPSSLIGQWEGEVSKRVRRGKLSVEVHHGNSRETKARRLANYDIVVTTYNIVQVDFQKKESPLFSIRWRRIILDEAHQIRNHKTKTALSVFGLKGKGRFALTGTPIHNKTADFYALAKFIKCSPFDDLQVWKKWVDNKDAAGTQRLNTITQAVMLRRTKQGLQEKGELKSLTQRIFKIVPVTLDTAEKEAYQKLLMFSKSLFGQFLHQQALKKNALEYIPVATKTTKYLQAAENPFQSDPELARLHKTMKQINEVKSHHILVMLLRLRQFCCQPSLVNSMLEKEDTVQEGIEDSEGLDIDLVDKIGRMSIGAAISDQANTEINLDSDKLSVKNPIFSTDRVSSKVRGVMGVLEEILPTGDKVIIVSQWVCVLDILEGKLKERRVKIVCLNGKVPVQMRSEIVESFNCKGGPRVMLLSLTAGGVGLNLVGANHLLLIDLHWNPQLESQACDRIYRVGQKKDVFIYKFVASDTIEERVHDLQQKKLEIAEGVLTGKVSSKLSLDDLKLLFEMK